MMTEVYVYPTKHLAEIGLTNYGQEPVGSGKWKLKSWDKGVKTVLERFEDHWGWGPPALLDEIEFKGYPEDATRVAALRADEVDIIMNLPADDAAGIETEGLKVQWTEIAQAMVLMMVPKEGTPFRDKQVRKAISHGIDIDSLINNIMLGFGTKLEGQFTTPGTVGHNPDVKAYPYDPDKAKQMLADAGYPDGFSTEFDIAGGRYAKQKEMNEALAGQLAEIGIECKINMMEWAALVDKVWKEESSPMFYVGWNYYNAMDADLVNNWVLSTNTPNFFATAPKEMDEAVMNSRQEFDPQKRLEYLQEFARIMREEAPCVCLFASPSIFGVQPRVQDFVPSRDDAIHFWGIHIEE
jgi:peptide/nickel transport system substrate-binding protein